MFTLESHPHYEYRISDAVLMLPSVTQGTTDASICVGEIISLKDGRLEVCWANGTILWFILTRLFPLKQRHKMTGTRYQDPLLL